MTNYSRSYVMPLLTVLLVLIVALLLSSCQTIKPRLPVMQKPLIQCEERSPAEPAFPLPSGSTDWRAWRKAALAWVGIATIETEKRATTADCLDRLRDSGVIR